ncbi:hypothetical protein J3S90_12080 [Flavobacterium sp. P4023]|uniref:Natural product n=1 Tax=Flavobacterium flabelliforme TaxID=2816119 RepID=A0ABS5CV90_9FLAO|nr:hypothetical protein [Flavobacterium flabelliforme]MBP4142540.1 hypothetical protein [Flavobacterium flabelliforme]
MKTIKKQALSNKFNLEKMKVAKLENLHLVNGGNNALAFDGDVATVTQSKKAETVNTISY